MSRLTSEAREVEGSFVLPIEVTNRGERTIKDLRIEVTTRSSGGGGSEPTEVTVDYLGEKASAKVYVFVDRDPRELPVEARPQSYQLE